MYKDCICHIWYSTCHVLSKNQFYTKIKICMKIEAQLFTDRESPISIILKFV